MWQRPATRYRMRSPVDAQLKPTLPGLGLALTRRTGPKAAVYRAGPWCLGPSEPRRWCLIRLTRYPTEKQKATEQITHSSSVNTKAPG